MNAVTFFAPRGKSLRIGKTKFNNHSYTTSNAAEIKKIRDSSGFGKSIFELPVGVSPTQFIMANPTRIGTITTSQKPETDQDLGTTLSEFLNTRLAEIMDTEARMNESKNSPMLSHSSLMNYNKDTLIQLCKQFGVEHDESETRKSLIAKLKDISKPPEE